MKKSTSKELLISNRIRYKLRLGYYVCIQLKNSKVEGCIRIQLPQLQL